MVKLVEESACIAFANMSRSASYSGIQLLGIVLGAGSIISELFLLRTLANGLSGPEPSTSIITDNSYSSSLLLTLAVSKLNLALVGILLIIESWSRECNSFFPKTSNYSVIGSAEMVVT